MLRYQDIAEKPHRVRSLTNLEPNEFADLVSAFEHCFLEHMREYTIDGLPRLNRRYTPYKNSPLPTTEDKLLFSLVHIKQHLTQEVQGELFEMGQSDAHKWLRLLRPLLFQSLQALDTIPSRLATILAEKEGERRDEPLFSIMMVPNALFTDQETRMSKENTIVAKRNVTP